MLGGSPVPIPQSEHRRPPMLHDVSMQSSVQVQVGALAAGGEAAQAAATKLYRHSLVAAMNNLGAAQHAQAVASSKRAASGYGGAADGGEGADAGDAATAAAAAAAAAPVRGHKVPPPPPAHLLPPSSPSPRAPPCPSTLAPGPQPAASSSRPVSCARGDSGASIPRRSRRQLTAGSSPRPRSGRCTSRWGGGRGGGPRVWLCLQRLIDVVLPPHRSTSRRTSGWRRPACASPRSCCPRSRGCWTPPAASTPRSRS